MKTLVLGGNRYFGKKLVSLLLERGDQVTVLNRGSREDGFGDRIRRIRCDRSDARDLHRAVGSSEWDFIYDQICYNADEAEAANRIFSGKVGRYIFTSTKSVYLAGSDLREEAFDPLKHRFNQRETYTSNYGEAKRQAEATFFQSRAFPVTAVRFPIVLGMEDYTQRLVFHIEHILQHRPIYFPNISAKTCFVDSDDAAQVLLRLSEIDVTGPLNVCSPDAIALDSLVQMMEGILKVKATLCTEAALGDHSPIGIEADWYMNTSKLKSLGLELPVLADWLPQLIQANFIE